MLALEILLLGAAVVGAAWGSVLVHEAGHYVAGRWSRVPADSIRIRLERPPHVALRQGDRWLSPDDRDYPAAFAKHNPSTTAAWIFVAAGFLVETLIVVLLAALLHDVGTLSLVILGASTVVMVGYVTADVVLSARWGRPYGDFVAMMQVARGVSVATVGLALLLRVVTILLLL